MTAPNPFLDLRSDTHSVIERLLYDIHAAGEFSDEHDALLTQWRNARGDAALDRWSWWVGEVDGESYEYEFSDRDAAIAMGRTAYAAEGQFEIIEGRMWNDNVMEGEEITSFAATRNREVVRIEA